MQQVNVQMYCALFHDLICVHVLMYNYSVVLIFLDSGQRSDGYSSVSDVHPQLGRSVPIGTH